MKGGVLARRAGIIALCVLSLAVCVGLAVWQWNRFENGGTWQNLGYVLQWPLFGLFPAFVFWRLRKLRLEPAEQPPARPSGQPARRPTGQPAVEATERPEPHQAPPQDPDKPVARQNGGSTGAAHATTTGATDAAATGATATAAAATGATATGAAATGAAGADDDPELAAYNRYLAQLNARHQQETR